MGAKVVGYIRISTLDQSIIRQLKNVEVDRLFTDIAAGTDRNRPQLDALLRFAQDGDTVVVHSMSRLARNLGDLYAIVRTLTDKQVQVSFVEENLTFSGDEITSTKPLLAVMQAFANFERALNRERQRERFTVAKETGVRPGRKKALSAEQAAEIVLRITNGEKQIDLAPEFGVSRQTLARYLPPGTRGPRAPRSRTRIVNQ